MNLTIDRDTKAYLDFVQGVKGQNAREMIPEIVKTYETRVAEREAPEPADFRAALEIMRDEPQWIWYEKLTNYSQYMMWDGVLDIVADNWDTISRELETPIANPRGSLSLDPAIELPRYYRDSEFHLRPGGMWNGKAQGFLTDIANWVYFAGSNDNREGQYGAVSQLPDGPFDRVLDMACGIGQSTWPLAERYTATEIHGCDLSAPLVTYAHKVAEERGLAIHYKQANAAHTGYPDGWFGLVLAYILFHEIPNGAAIDVIAEAYRVLEPGGTFAIADVRPYNEMGPIRAMVSDFQTYGNGESYWRSHGQRDFPALLTAAGFTTVHRPAPRPGARAATTIWLATRPA